MFVESSLGSSCEERVIRPKCSTVLNTSRNVSIRKTIERFPLGQIWCSNRSAGSPIDFSTENKVQMQDDDGGAVDAFIY